MSDRLNVIVRTREQAHEAVMHGYTLAKALLQDGKPVHIQIGEDEDPLTVKQRAFLHAAVFPQIAEQVVMPDGTRYVAQVWKEYFRARFLGDRWVCIKVPRWDKKLCRLVQPKRATPHRQRVSTEDLTVKQYSEHIDRVIDTAVDELGVVFHFIAEEREAVRYRPPERKQRKPEAAIAA